MNNRNEKPTRHSCWGNEPSVSRKRRKRHASKIRRQRRQADLRERRRDASL